MTVSPSLTDFPFILFLAESPFLLFFTQWFECISVNADPTWGTKRGRLKFFCPCFKAWERPFYFTLRGNGYIEIGFRTYEVNRQQE